MATKRIANQVHRQASRLLREGYIQREPAWFRAVLDNPPLPLPARSPPLRTHFDTPSPATPLTPHADSKTTKPLPIKYVEDEIRRQFFRDHPFEDAFARNARLLPNGRLIHDMLTARIKAPSEQRHPWDYYEILGAVPATEAFRPIERSKCRSIF